MGEIIEFNKKNESLKKKITDIRCYCLSFGIKNDLTNFESFYSNLKNILKNKTIKDKMLIESIINFNIIKRR